MQFMQHSRRASSGFTLVEVLVVAPIVLLVVGTFVGTIMFLTGEVLSTRASNTMAYQVQDSLEVIEQDVRLSGAFLAQNNDMTASTSTRLVSPQGLNNSTQAFTSFTTNTDTLILNTIATNRSPQDPNRSPIYLTNAPNACNSAQIQQNQVMTVNVIYFVKNNALWRRTLAPENYQTRGCNSVLPWQLPSCDPAVSNTFCRTQDTKLLEGVTPDNFKVEYFSSASSTSATANTKSTNVTTRQNAMNNTNTVQITINGTQTIAGREVSQSGTIRATRIGSLITYATPTN